MQKRKYLFLLAFIIPAVFILDSYAFSSEEKRKSLAGNGWKLELAAALLTKELGNVVTGGLHAPPGKSILVLHFNVRYGKDAKPAESAQSLEKIMKSALILDAGSGRAITCPSIGGIKSSFLTEREKSGAVETGRVPSPTIRTAIEKGKVTKIYYTACVEGNSKQLVFVLPNLGKFELETLIYEKESLWQGPHPDSSWYPEKPKD